MTIKGIQDKIKKSEYRFSDHAIKRMIKRSVDRHEVEEVVLGGEIIEEYPDKMCVLWRERREKEGDVLLRRGR